MTIESFKSGIAADFPAIPKAPPPVPPVPPVPPKAPPPVPPKAPPPVPPKAPPPVPPSAADALRAIAADIPSTLTDAPLVRETGVINPPEAPAEAPKSPEEAVVQQGIVAPVQVIDDLDAMDRAALKELAVAIGAVTPANKARESGLRDAIRSHRQKLAVLSATPAAESAAEEQVDNVARAAETRAQLEAMLDELPAAAPAPSEDAPARAESTYTLFVNCFVTKAEDDVSVIDVADLVAEANGVLALEHDTNGWDYRLVDFGKGAPLLIKAVMNILDSISETFYITLDTRTPEGSVLLVPLTARATTVVRGF